MADDGWTPSHRPESTIVQTFSADLDAMFGLGSGEGLGTSAGSLEQTVEDKKQTVNSASTELEQLEAKLRETEQRLAKVSRGNSPQRQANTGLPRSYPDQQAGSGAAGRSPLAQKPTYPADRPPTATRPQEVQRKDTNALMAGMPGAMPQTPQRQYSNSNDYVMVDRGLNRSRQSVG